MMAPFAKLSLILLLWTTMVVEGDKALFHFPGVPSKTIVEIINNLTDPTQNLTLHCKSKDDDLGEHTINAGEKYEFKFRPNVFKPTTLFFCDFRWPSDPSLHYFDIYVQRRDEDSCVEHEGFTLCSWKIWERGACKYDRFKKAHTTCDEWNHPPAMVVSSSIVHTSHV